MNKKEGDPPQQKTERDRGVDELAGPFTTREFYRALAERPRRRVMAYLLEHQETTRAELADVLSGWEATEDEGTMTTPERREEITVRLHHVHLPKLADAGLITYDQADGRVCMSELSEPVRQHLLRELAEV